MALSLTVLPVLFPFCIGLLFPLANTATVNFFYFLFNFVMVAVILRKFFWASVQQMGFRPIRLIFSVLLGLFSYYLMNYFVSSLLFYWKPDFFNVNDNSISLLAQQNYTLIAFGTIFLVPVAEEGLYRGVLFGILRDKKPVFSILASSLLFASIHVVGYIGAYDATTLLLCLLQYLPAGICLSWVYLRANNIFAPILMHAIINAVGIFSMR